MRAAKMPVDGGGGSNGRRSLLSIPRSLIPKRTPSPIRFGRKFRSSEKNASAAAAATAADSLSQREGDSKSENNESVAAAAAAVNRKTGSNNDSNGYRSGAS